MNMSVIAAIAYGVLAIVGGLIGYAQAKSKISLIAGVVSGILLIVGGVLLAQGQTLGLGLSSVVTIVLLVTFGMRLAKTRKFMPAGLMLLLGIPVLGMLVSQWMALN